MSVKIYTKTGDEGTTSLIGGARVRKDDQRIEACGAIDELNAALGVLCTLLSDKADRVYVERVQSDLFVVGSHLVSDSSHASRYRLNDDEVSRMEQEIDSIVQVIPPQHTFLLPGGCPAAAQAQVCRTVCRRAERRLVTLGMEQPIQEEIMCFVNRLSDYLYVLARKSNFHERVTEKKWEITW